jgi:rhomboid protease GluP
MASRVCPYCQGLNGESETRCYRCGKALPGPIATEALGVVRGFLGSEAPMTKLVIGMELVVFALCIAAELRNPERESTDLMRFLGFNAFGSVTLIRFGALFGPLLEYEPWRFLSACFIHAGVLHVGMNMFMFSSLGAQLEREFGGARATLVFLFSGMLGFVGTVLWRGPDAFSVGASGGVFGQVGAVIGVLLARGDPRWKKALGQMLLYALLLTLALGGIDTAAHLGGLFAGVALGFVFHFEQRKLRLHRTAGVLAALMLLASVASVVLSTQSPILKGEVHGGRLGE